MEEKAFGFFRGTFDCETCLQRESFTCLGHFFFAAFCTAVVSPAEELKSILSKDYVEKLSPPKWKIETFPGWLASADCSKESRSNIENFSDLTSLCYNFHFEAKSFFHLIISLFYV